MDENLYQVVHTYFSEKISTHGTTPRGVDWNGQEAQERRFEQLIKILPGQDDQKQQNEEDFSVLDFGCGYGAFLNYLQRQNINCRYIGFDCVPEMIDQANQLFGNVESASFVCGKKLDLDCDYAIASGVFNYKGDSDFDKWTDYVLESLDTINSHARSGFAVNFLTSYSDEDKKRDDLYYPDPAFYFHHSKVNYSKNVAILHDYGLYEFCLLVRKDLD